MRVSVYFYQPLATDSVLLAHLQKLFSDYDTRFRIGLCAGFGATHLCWQDAMTLAAKIVVTILKTESASIFSEMRLLVQTDEPTASLLPASLADDVMV